MLLVLSMKLESLSSVQTRLLTAVADGHCYPATTQREKTTLVNLAAAGYLRRVARAVYALTPNGRERLAGRS